MRRAGIKNEWPKRKKMIERMTADRALMAKVHPDLASFFFKNPKETPFLREGICPIEDRSISIRWIL